MCPYCQAPQHQIVKYGFFSRINGHRSRIQRFLCKVCRRKFSNQTSTLTFRERKPHLTQPVMRLLMEGLSQRACARILGCQRRTVAAKLQRLGSRARQQFDHRKAAAAISTLIPDH